MFTTQKVRIMFYLVGIFRTLSPGDRISSNPERTGLKRQEEPSYIEVCNKEQVVLRQKIDGLQFRHLQLTSCLHFTGQEEVGFRPDT